MGRLRRSPLGGGCRQLPPRRGGSGASRLAACELAPSARPLRPREPRRWERGAGRRLARGGGRKAGAPPRPRVRRAALALGTAGPPPLARGPREPAEWCPAAGRVRLRYRGTSPGTGKGNTLLIDAFFFSLRRSYKGSFFLSKFAI